MVDNVRSVSQTCLKCQWFEALVSFQSNQLIHCNDEADKQDFSKNGYEVAGLQQLIDMSDDDKLGHVFYQAEVH